MYPLVPNDILPSIPGLVSVAGVVDVGLVPMTTTPLMVKLGSPVASVLMVWMFPEATVDISSSTSVAPELTVRELPALSTMSSSTFTLPEAMTIVPERSPSIRSLLALLTEAELAITPEALVIETLPTLLETVVVMTPEVAST